MYNLFLGISSLLAAWLLRIFSKPFESLALKSVSLLDVLISKEEDEVKAKLLQDKLGGVLLYLLLSIILISGAVLLALLPFFFTNDSIGDWPGILSLAFGSTLGFFFPRKKQVGAYSGVAKMLHRLALNNYNLHLKLHRREVKRCNAKGRSSKNEFFIITGLARSGTTNLLNTLAEKKHLQSLNYGNMPLILAPNTWGKVFKPKAGELKERSHKDGIMVNNISYEALEEYFFKAITNDSYIQNESIATHELTIEEHEAYLNYQMLIRPEESDFYLAKNNNFIVRYSSMRKLNKEFKMLLMFRDPLSHSASLLEKHLQYEASQSEDKFELEYMNWLGHHEFGKGQKPFNFTGEEALTGDKTKLDFWLKSWINYYEYVLSLSLDNVLLVCYEEYCAEPMKELKKIYEFLNISHDDKWPKAFINQRKIEIEHDHKLLSEAKAIYNQLIAKV